MWVGSTSQLSVSHVAIICEEVRNRRGRCVQLFPKKRGCYEDELVGRGDARGGTGCSHQREGLRV
jgi:hypothetical protein